MHLSELDQEERQSFERSMETVRGMEPDEQWAIIEHSVATSIRHARTHKDQVLTDWAQGLLSTLRVHTSKAYRGATEGHRRPDRDKQGVTADDLIASIRR